jgi:hypothetical protein
MQEVGRSWFTSWIAIGGRLDRRGRLLEFGKLNLNERLAGKMGFIAWTNSIVKVNSNYAASVIRCCLTTEHSKPQFD